MIHTRDGISLEHNIMKITITLTCSNRADYLKNVVDSLFEADKTNLELLLLPSIDYNSLKVIDIINQIDFITKDVVIHNPRLGCNQNTLFAINRGMLSDFSDYILHLEDDTPLAKDALQFFSFCFNEFKDDEKIVSIGGYSKTEELDESETYTLIKEPFFSAWGCGFWKHKWNIIEQHWTNSRVNSGMSWDSHLNQVLFVEKQFLQVRPSISRVQNIGATNGTWVHDPAWHYYNHRSPYLSNDIENTIDWISYAKNNK